jgi:hypothetical protein
MPCGHINGLKHHAAILSILAEFGGVRVLFSCFLKMAEVVIKHFMKEDV